MRCCLERQRQTGKIMYSVKSLLHKYKTLNPSQMVVHTFNSSSWEIADLCEFRASLVYRVNSRPTMAVQTLSKTRQRKRSWGWREDSAVEYLLLRSGFGSQYLGWLTALSNFSSRGPDVFWPLGTRHKCRQTTHTHKSLNLKFVI